MTHQKEAEKKEKKEVKKEAEDYKETLQRLQAEFENYKKRVDKENGLFRKYANAELIKSFLPTLDSFEMALKNTADKDTFVKGIELIYAQFYSLLEEQGLKKIKAEGRFDPYNHECLLQEESDKDEQILEELQKGYMLNDVVIRHSKVKIGKKKDKLRKSPGDDKNE